MRDDYRLLPAPRALQRRGSRIVTLTMLAIALVAIVLISTLEGARFDGITWFVLLVTAATFLGTARITYLRLSPDDRETLRLASHRVLDPLPPADAVEIRLAPGKRQRRRMTPDSPSSIAVTAEGLAVPGWVLHVPPRRVGPDEIIHLPWSDVTKFRVCNDSDGPDLYHVTVRADGGRDPVWRVRRHEVTDEIALLDAVRAVGQQAIDLEADVARPSPPRDE